MITPDAYRELQTEIHQLQVTVIRILHALNAIVSRRHGKAEDDAKFAFKVKAILYPEGEEGSGDGTDQTLLAP